MIIIMRGEPICSVLNEAPLEPMLACYIQQSAISVWKQRRFIVDNFMFGVQLADVSTRCSSHPRA